MDVTLYEQGGSELGNNTKDTKEKIVFLVDKLNQLRAVFTKVM